MNYVDIFVSNTKAHLVLTKLSKRMKPYSFETISFEEKMNLIEQYLDKQEEIILKVFFGEHHNDFLTYLSVYEPKNIELIKEYKGKSLPGIVNIYCNNYDKIFIRSLLLCHFNNDFSVNPKLKIHPHFLVKSNSSITILDIYDDRGMYVFEEKKYD